MKYDSKLNLEEKNSLSVLLKRVAPNSTVLEFGPANGRMTRYLKESLHCRVYAVEIDEEAAQESMGYTEKMLIDSIESYRWKDEFAGITFDAIIFADVLEHLYDTQKVLESVKEFLKEDGSLLVSLPNISHNAIVINLLKNEFTYNKTGLLDDTHLRFFTKNSFDKVIQKMGYYTCYEGAIYLDPQYSEFANHYSDLDLHVADYLRRLPFGEVYQLIYELKKIPCNLTSDFGQTGAFIQLYVSDSDEFYEEASLKKFVGWGSNLQEFEFDLRDWKDIKNLRLDPLNTSCVLELERVFLRLKGLEEIDMCDHISSNACVIKENSYFFNTADPQMSFIDFKAEDIEAFVVRLAYHYINEKALDICEKEIAEINFHKISKEKVDLERSLLGLQERLACLEQEALESHVRVACLEQEALESQGRIACLEQEALESHTALSRLENELANLYGSKSWRITAPLRDTIRKVKTIYEAGRSFRLKLVKIALLMQKIQQNPTLVKKGFLSLRSNGIRNTIAKIKQNLNVAERGSYYSPICSSFLHLPLTRIARDNHFKIAVVIHAFYIDVLEDIVSSIDHISPKPDLYISISNDANADEIDKFLRDKGYSAITIAKVPNVGRDVAPFLIEFGQKLQEYDICCKIHGKKSLYTGSEQSNWRNHIYHNLLGSPEIVNDILGAFVENPKLGLAFSDSMDMIPYWGYTWLTNKPVVLQLIHRLKLTSLSTLLDLAYIDFPAGTMFWFRPDAIKQILNADFTYSDFPREPIENDGTIAHGLERLFGYVARFNNYDFIELNYKSGFYSRNMCHKNFNQLEFKTLHRLKETILNAQSVMFDIFDTLVTRTVFYPDNVFRILEKMIDKEFSIQSDFFNIRKETEKNLRQQLKNGEDVSYHSIYKNMEKFGAYKSDVIRYAQQYEFELELKVLRSKPEMIDVLNFAHQHKKKIIFVSDMYLSTKQIVTILKDSLGINIDNVTMYISSDSGYRKDNGSIWSHLIESNIINPTEAIMIGDNEVSDAKKPGDVRFKHIFHLFSEKTSFFESPLGKIFTHRHGRLNERDMALLGPVINKIFHSPFDMSKTVLNFHHTFTPYEFGYVAIAPFMYLFVNQIYNNHADNKLFFLSRDGYFLKEIYEYFLTSKGLHSAQELSYLLVSRRALLGAVAKNPDNLKSMILDIGEYNGYFSELIFNRIGLNDEFLKQCGIDDFLIHHTGDLKKAYDLLVVNIELINEYSAIEYRNYFNYLNDVGFFDCNENIIVDLGYSGTIQKYLYAMTHKKIIGEYFITTDKVKNIEHANNVFHGYFVDKVDIGDRSNILYRYALILEAYLTSNKGQLIRFDDNNQPIYKADVNTISTQEKITHGVKDYIRDLSVVNVDFFDLDNSNLKDISQIMFEYIIANRYIDDELRGLFFLEDDFTGNGRLDILDILSQRRD